MKIRQLTKQDIPAVAQIAQISMPYPWDEKVFLDCLGENYHSWVLELNEEVIGFVVILLQADECQLMNIAIKPAYRRQGLAQQLLQHAITFAKSQQVKRLLLEVRQSNHAAIAFYQKSGGKNIAVRKNYYPSATGREDALIFCLDI